MKKFVNLALAIAAATACSVASADMITFESTAPDVFNGGHVFSEGLTKLTVLGPVHGFLGATVAAGDGFACLLLTCPKGNPSSYYLGLNDGGLSVEYTAGGPIRLQSLDFGFAAPLPGVIGFTVGQLQVTGTRANGTTASIAKDFSGQDANGNFGFTPWNISGSFLTFSQTDFKSITFNACLFDGTGACTTFGANQAQFAIDNIAVAVPEPSTWLLMGLGLAGVGAFARRKSV